MNESDKLKRRTYSKRHYIYTALALFGGLALAILFFFLLFRLGDLLDGIAYIGLLLRPILIGVAIAYVLKPLCNLLERGFLKLFRKAKNPRTPALVLSVTISILIGLAVVYLFLVMVIPALYDSIRDLIVPFLSAENAAPLEPMRAAIARWFSEQSRLSAFLNDGIDALEEWLRTTLTSEKITEFLKFGTVVDLLNSLYSGASAVIRVVVDVLVGLVAGVYVLIMRKRLGAQARMVLYGFVPEKWALPIEEEVRYADKMFNGFLYSRIIDSVIVGILCFIGMLFFDTRYAVLISVVVGVTNIIPFFGPFIGAIPSAFLLLTESSAKCFWFVIFILILQQIDGNIIGPRLSSDAMGLPDLWVLVALLLFGGFWGFVGMLVGVPIFAVIYDIIRRLVERGLARHGKTSMLADYSKNFPASKPRPFLFGKKRTQKKTKVAPTEESGSEEDGTMP